MTIEVLYTYLGTNGSVTTPVHLEGVPSIKRLRLKADADKVLTNGECKTPTATIAEADLDKWSEIEP